MQTGRNYVVCDKCGGVTSRPESVGEHKYCLSCTDKLEKLEQALRELVEKSEAANMEITECLVSGWGLPPETIRAIRELQAATLKAKEVLPK